MAREESVDVILNAWRPIYYIASLFGTTPVRLNKVMGRYRVHTSWVQVSYSILLLVVLTSAYVLSLEHPSSVQQDDFMRLVYSFRSMADLAMNFIIILFAIFNQKRFQSTVNLAFSLHYKFEISGNTTARTRIRNLIFIEMCYPFVILLLPFGLYQYFNIKRNTKWSLLESFLYVGPKVSIYLMEIHFLNGIMVVYSYFHRVNKNLSEMVDTAENGTKKAWTNKQVALINSEDSQTTIERLRSLHDSICDVAEHVNGLFSLQILLALAVVFIDATLNIFYSYTQIAIVVAGQGADLVSQLYSLYWVALSAIEVVVMATVCESAANEINLVNTIIQIVASLTLFGIWPYFLGIGIKLEVTRRTAIITGNRTSQLVRRLAWHMREPNLARELESFSLQLQHRPVRFTAGGYFQLDFTLLYSMVGSITTYLVILIQFHGRNGTLHENTSPNETSVSSPSFQNEQLEFPEFSTETNAV